MSPTNAPGQFSITFPDPPSPIWVVVFLVAATLTVIVVIANVSRGYKLIGADILVALLVFFGVYIIVAGALVRPYSMSDSYLKTDFPLTHMSEQAGVDFINSSYSKENRIFSVNDDTASYNFLASDGKNSEGKKVIYLTLQQ